MVGNIIVSVLVGIVAVWCAIIGISKLEQLKGVQGYGLLLIAFLLFVGIINFWTK